MKIMRRAMIAAAALSQISLFAAATVRAFEKASRDECAWLAALGMLVPCAIFGAYIVLSWIITGRPSFSEQSRTPSEPPAGSQRAPMASCSPPRHS